MKQDSIYSSDKSTQRSKDGIKILLSGLAGCDTDMGAEVATVPRTRSAAGSGEVTGAVDCVKVCARLKVCGVPSCETTNM